MATAVHPLDAPTAAERQGLMTTINLDAEERRALVNLLAVEIESSRYPLSAQ